jgi:aspartate-semialdehyde dehydrogenase
LEGLFFKLKIKKTDKMKVAVVGATGLVGSKMLQVLEERNFPVDELISSCFSSICRKGSEV